MDVTKLKFYCPLDGLLLTVELSRVTCPSHGSLVDMSTTSEYGTMEFAFKYQSPFAMQNFEEVKDVPEETPDIITKPSHYNQYTGFEVMDVCRQLVSPDGIPASTWFRGNVFKYLARAGWKGFNSELQDLEKAAEYLRREIERVKTRDDVLTERFNAGVKAGMTTEREFREAMEQGADPEPNPIAAAKFRSPMHHPYTKPTQHEGVLGSCGFMDCVNHPPQP